MTSSLPGRPLESRILVIRETRVVLDTDLAKLYGVEVRALNQAVRRNIDRFPSDFAFQLTKDELESLRSQIVILADGVENRRGKHAEI